MATTANDLSVAQLEKMLSTRKSLLDTLERKRDRLRKDLDRVERKIASIEGKRTTIAGNRRRRRGKRPKNSKSLHEVVIELLAKNKKGYALSGLHDAVLATGYKTNSTNFKNVLYQCLYNSKKIMHDPKTALYRLK